MKSCWNPCRCVPWHPPTLSFQSINEDRVGQSPSKTASPLGSFLVKSWREMSKRVFIEKAIFYVEWWCSSKSLRKASLWPVSEIHPSTTSLSISQGLCFNISAKGMERQSIYCLYFRVNVLWSCILWAGLINSCCRKKSRHWPQKRKMNLRKACCP